MNPRNRPTSGQIHCHPEFEHCALCRAEIHGVSSLAFAMFAHRQVLAYLLCDACMTTVRSGRV